MSSTSTSDIQAGLRVGVFGAILTERAELMLLHRNDMDRWCLPGGLMEVGESIEQCLIRECREELGADIALRSLVGVYSDPGRHLFRTPGGVVHYATLVFHVAVVSGVPTSVSSESRAVKYFSFDNLPNVVPSHRVWIEDTFVSTAGSAPFIR